MTKLREQMTRDVVLGGVSPNAQRPYLQAVTQLARHDGRSPDRISKRQVEAYLLSLHQDAKGDLELAYGIGPAKRERYGAGLLAAVSGGGAPEAHGQSGGLAPVSCRHARIACRARG